MDLQSMIMFTTDTMKYFNIHEFPFKMLLISCHKYHKVNAKKTILFPQTLSSSIAAYMPIKYRTIIKAPHVLIIKVCPQKLSHERRLTDTYRYVCHVLI